MKRYRVVRTDEATRKLLFNPANVWAVMDWKTGAIVDMQAGNNAVWDPACYTTRSRARIVAKRLNEGKSR